MQQYSQQIEPFKQYLVSCIKCLLLNPVNHQKLVDSPVLNNFIISKDQQSLILLYVPKKGFKIFNPNDTMPSNGQILFILKLQQFSHMRVESIRECFSISLLPSETVEYLCQDIDTLYLPYAEKNHQELVGALENVQSSLSTDDNANENQFEGKLNRPQDEFNFWKRMREKEGDSKKKAEIYLKLYKYENMDERWINLKEQKPQELKDLIDITLGTLDSIWESKANYNPERFKTLVEAFTKSLWIRLSAELPKIQMTRSLEEEKVPYKKKIKEIKQVFNFWVDMVKQSHELRWTGNVLKPAFKGKLNLESYVERLDELEQIISLLSQLNAIRSKIQNSETIDGIEDIFSNIQVMGMSENNNRQWEIAKRKFQIKIQGAERDISRFLKSKVISVARLKEKPIKTFKELLKWGKLLNRKNVSKALSHERQAIFKEIESQIETTKHEYESRTGQSIDPIPNKQQIPMIKNFSRSLSEIIWVKQFNDKTNKILVFFSQLFKNHTQNIRVVNQINEFIRQMKRFQTQVFDNWKSRTLEEIRRNQDYSFDSKSKMVDLDLNTGIVKINYSDKLVGLIKEIRQLSDLGYRKQIPETIIQTSNKANKFYKQALNLKKIAHYYNNLSDQIIQPQKAMILQQRMAFQNSVKNVDIHVRVSKNQPTYITWQNTEYVSTYIDSLTSSLNILQRQNSRLKKLHNRIIDILSELFNYDLASERNKWQDSLVEIKRLIDLACENKDQKQCRRWRTHCDVQLYRVLELQYLRGVEDMETTISDIDIEIIIRNKALTFKPPIEQIKDRYYKQLKEYIEWPVKEFKGITGGLDLYRRLPDKNNQHLVKIFSKSEEIFRQLIQYSNELNHWGVVSYLSVPQMKSKLKTMKDWEDTIKLLKLKRKDLERMNDYQKIDCFNINNMRFKNQVDETLQKVIDSLMTALKQSIEDDSDTVEIFILQNLKKLENRPESLEQIQKIKNEYLNIKSKQKEIDHMNEQVHIKNKWLLQTTGFGHNIQKLKDLWEKFTLKISDFDTLLKEQMEHLKSLIQGKTISIKNEIQKYEAKTTLFMPTKRSEVLDLVQTLRQYKQQEDKLQQKIQNLKNDCLQFQAEVPNLSLKTIDWNVWNILIEYFDSMKTYQQCNLIATKQQSNKLFEWQDAYTKWIEQLRNRERTPQVVYLLKEIELFKNIFPVLKQLSGGILERQHWRTLYSLLKMSGQFQDIKLGYFLNIASTVWEKNSEIKDLISKAQGQVVLRQAIQELTIWSETAAFEITQYQNNSRKTPLIKQWSELTTKVSDNLALIFSLKESKYAHKFMTKITEFQTKMGNLDSYLSKLKSIQRRWIYLEPIFIKGSLPEQAKRFELLDTNFRNIMLRIRDNNKVINLLGIEGIGATLDNIEEQQQRCQKALNDFLEQKRNKFPRFYFLGDEDLLQILGQSKNPLIIQQHLKKLFAAIHTVQIVNDSITAICSVQQQVVYLVKKVAITETVESWLLELEKGMFETLDSLFKQYISSSKSLALNQYPSQILCLMEQVRFSEQLQKAITSKQLPKLQAQIKLELEKLTSILPSLTGVATLKLKAIILDIIHRQSIVSEMVASKDPINLNSYLYTKNFKISATTRNPQIRMLNYSYQYTFQYQGNLPKLVHTPLTDKCYITLALAMSLGYGGNPYGPAGTGKTQTVKSLGMFFGRMVLVFNCDEGLDYKSIARIFLGLVRCGAWGCFDEFNRLKQDQLSAISQSIQIIQNALKSRQRELQLLGKKVDINHNSGIFVTLNPAGKGYGGRSKLPDNLKQLFRPIAMSVPDNQLIAEVLLYAEGFKEAKTLSKKIICLFTLSKQLLSPQQHYDWGLRALKTILIVSGRLIFEQRKRTGKQVEAENEAQLLIKAIRINTLSKLTFPDMRKFKLLLSDIFPGIKSQDISYPELQATIPLVLQQMNLSNNPNQISKILQFYEATKQRMGVVLVGPSGCGKTTIIKVLKRCYEKLNIGLKTYLINPKSMPKTQLLGLMNNDTREFTEGVMTLYSRELVKNGGNNWIVLDGDIDPEWIESLNSVLDDNHLLTLPTGERINFSKDTCFIFETDSLLYASPATVSRMGMIYLNNQDISVPNLIEKESRNKQNTQLIRGLINTIDIQKLLSLISEHQIIKSTLVGRTIMVLSMLKQVKDKKHFIQKVFKGLTANTHSEIKPKILSMLFDKLGQRNPLDSKCLSFYVHKQQFKTFSQNSKDFILSELLNEPIAIQTAIFLNTLSTIEPWINDGSPFIVVGSEGCGKSLLIKQAFKQLQKTVRVNMTTIHCNSQTKSTEVINKLYQITLKGNKGGGKILKPKDCSRQVLYLKDINLPKPDKYDTIELISFLQQLISHKGFYDPESLEFITLDDKIQIVCSMLPSTSIGRYQLTSRFTSIIRIVNVESPNSIDLNSIYTLYFKAMLKQKQLDLSYSTKLSQFLIEVYNSIKQKFNVDEERHYKFTPKNLYEIFVQLVQYDTPDINTFIEALGNQLLRGYRDRLVGYQTKSKFDTLLVNLAKQHFKVSINTSSLFCFIGSKISKISKEDYSSIIRQSLVQYQREYKELNLIMLDETVNSINTIQKKLGCGGNLLLCGKSGGGRRTSVLLASLIEKIQVRSMPNVRGYSIRQFKKDMKSLIEQVTNQNKKLVLYIEDHNFSRPQFEQMINSLLSSSQIPGLFSNEEVDRLPCAEDIRRQVYGISLYEGFCRRVRNNLKIVISLDYSTSKFHTVCSSNPAFYGCTIVWFDDLLSSSLQDLSSNMICSELQPHSKKIAELSSTIHLSATKEYNASQRQFYNLIQTLNKIYLSKMSQKQNQSAHLQSGLDKLKQAQGLVDKLSTDAINKQKLLVQKRKQADQALKGIASAVQQATERKQQTERLSSSLYEQQKKIQIKKGSVEQELAEVKPLIELAKKSVEQISKSDLTELMSLKSPPEAIEHVMTAVIRMFGENQSSWNAMKSFLKGGVIDQVLNFDPTSITPEIRRDVEKVIQKHSNSFDDATIKRASKVAYPLSTWVKALLKFSKVLESIKPLQSELNNLLNALQSSKTKVIECEQKLKVLDERVKGLKQSYGKKVSETELLKKQLEQSEDTLKRARSLLSKLEDQKVRWEKDFGEIIKQTKELPFNSLLASAFTCYLSDKDETVRAKLVTQWTRLMEIDNFSYLKFMTIESTLLKWRSQGLPYDSLSLENSVITLNSCKVPLIIDSNSQAIDWFKKTNPKLQILSQQDSKFTNTLQLSVRFGKALLIQQLDKIEQILVPIIRKNTYQQVSRSVIKIGEQEVDYNPAFQLYLCTRNNSIELPNNIRGIITVVSYSVTKSGLESKLLSIVINHEKPELESKKIQLLENEEVLKMNLEQLEKKLLIELAESTGNILQNTSLLESLNKTKVESLNIAKSLKDSELLNINLDKQRNLYKSLAQKGAEIFLLLSDLYKINNMYKFSLSYFISIFIKCLKAPQNNENEQQKLSISTENLYRIVYNSIATSLFKNDRLAFGLHLLKGVKPELVGVEEWKFFTQSLPPVLETKINLPKWAPFKQTEMFNTFYAHLPGIANSVNFNDQSFQVWFNDESAKLPSLCNKLTAFQKVIIVQIFKPEKLQSSLNTFIMDGLGISSLAGNNQGLKLLTQQLKSDTPLLFIVSPGYDPSKELQEIAIQKVGKANYKQLSMGGQQDQQAVKLMKQAAQKGQWICFKNLHLVISWLPQLQKEFKALTKHPYFKLFFTTESHPSFPNILLETCLKLCYEAPPGIKKNLQRIYQLWQIPSNPQKCGLMFLLAYFHSIIQQRRTYIPQGWSKYYQFSYSDLKVAEVIIDSILKEYEESRSYNVKTLFGLFEQGIYGGRVDNQFDLQVLRSYLHKYFNHSLFEGNIELLPGVGVPRNQKQVANFINKLPEIDNPTMYGLPLNADKAVQRATTQRAISHLKSIRSLSNQNLKFQKEKWQSLLAPTINTWKKIYKHIKDLNFPLIKQSQLLNEDPIEGFVYIEASQALELVEIINNNIWDIEQVVFNNGLITTPIQKQCISLLQNVLPKQWQLIETKDGIPTQCFKVFGKKISQLKKWIQKIGNSTLLNDNLNLTDLFNPDVFINACKQKFSRKLKIPIDSLQTISTFNQNQIQSQEVIKLKGLLMQGSIVNRNYCIEQQPKNQGEFYQLPTLYISFVKHKAESDVSRLGQFSVFASQSRQKRLFTVKLAYEGKLEDRILAGTAIILPEI